jgi:DeoR/GlpR family transcriptional regulator of sugar metabolism
MQLMEHPNSETLFIGGNLSKSAKIAVGGEVIQHLGEIRPDICFLGVNGIDAKEGLTELEMEIVTVKRAMIKSSRKVYALAITEKLNSVRKMRVCIFQKLMALSRNSIRRILCSHLIII